jgi:predicted transcriptional regulator
MAEEDYQAWKLERVAEGIAAANRGELVDHDELFEELRRRYLFKSRTLSDG